MKSKISGKQVIARTATNYGNKDQLKKWILDKAKREDYAYKEFAEKLGCEPNRDAILEAVTTIVGRQSAIKDVMKKLDERQAKIENAKKKLAKARKLATQDIPTANDVSEVPAKVEEAAQVLEEADEPVSTEVSAEIAAEEPAKSEEILTTPKDTEESCSAKIAELQKKQQALDETYNLYTVQLVDCERDAKDLYYEADKLRKQLQEVSTKIDRVANDAGKLHDSMKTVVTAKNAIQQEINEWQARLEACSVKKFTIDDDLVSDKVEMLRMDNAAAVNSIIISFISRTASLSKEFYEFVELAQMEELRKVAAIMIAAADDSKAVFVLRKNSNVATLAKLAGVTVEEA